MALWAYDAASGATYPCRKVLPTGQGRCFQPVEVRLAFDARRRLVSRQAAMGTFLEGGA